MTYSVKQICELYSVSQATCLHWIHSGQLRSLSVGRDLGKKRARHRVTESALQEFELVRTLTPPVPRTRKRRRKQTDAVEFY